MTHETLSMVASNRTPEDRSRDRALAAGHRALAAGDLERSEASFTVAANTAATAADGHYGLGVVAAQRHDWATAETSFRTALAYDPGRTAAHYELGALWERQGERDRALAAYEQVLAQDPSHASAQVRVAELRRNQGLTATPAAPGSTSLGVGSVLAADGTELSRQALALTRSIATDGEVNLRPLAYVEFYAGRFVAWVGAVLLAVVAVAHVLGAISAALAPPPAAPDRVWKAAGLPLADAVPAPVTIGAAAGFVVVALVAASVLGKLTRRFAFRSQRGDRPATGRSGAPPLPWQQTSPDGSATGSPLRHPAWPVRSLVRTAGGWLVFAALANALGVALKTAKPSPGVDRVLGAIRGALPAPETVKGVGVLLVLTVATLAAAAGLAYIWCLRVRIDQGRLQVHSGLLSRDVANIDLWRVLNIELRQTLLNRLTGDGTLVFLDAQRGTVAIPGLARGQALKDLQQQLLNVAFLLRATPAVQGIVQ